MNNQKNKPKCIKVVQVGDLQVGKSSLYLRYKKNKNYFDDPQLIPVDFFTKMFEKDGQEVKFYFWDYGQDNRIHSIPTCYYKGCSVLTISYDITNRQSFEKVLFYLQEYNLKCKNDRAALFLVGNKCDLEQERQVSYQEGKQLSESLGMLFMEVSAKEDYQVNELFEKFMYNAFNIN